MQSIRLIDRNTDISKLKMHQMYWDTVINGEPYFVVLIEGYIQSVGNTEITIYGLIQEMKNQVLRILFNSMESLYVGV